MAGWLTRKADGVYRAFVFFAGDIRRLHSVPWVTWSRHPHAVSYEEVLLALPSVEYGDVGLHRDWGYLSNVAIPGFMKHAWIYVQNGTSRPEIVEAISEGVVCRSPIYPMHSDYAIILTPSKKVGITEEERKGACLKARQIVGEKYDHRFEFDIEAELKFYSGQSIDEARDHLQVGKEWIRRFDHAFSCTEVVSYCWWHRKEDLGVRRTERWGKSVILADSFLNEGWTIKWASTSVTADDARKFGLSDEGISLIEEYRKKGSTTCPEEE